MKPTFEARAGCILFAALAVGCGATKPAPARPDDGKLEVRAPWIDPEADYPRQQVAARDLRQALHNPAAKPLAIRNAAIWTAAGKRWDNGVIVLDGGAIQYVGDDVSKIPSGAQVIDAAGAVVTPGIIDAHSHIGLWAAPSSIAHEDGNEMTAPTTPQVRASYGYFPQDPQITRALAGGVTAALILPGSANLMGGHGFTVVMKPGATAADVAFPGAPATLKMACGENPKRTYGEKGGPQTRMSEYTQFREAFHQAAGYLAKTRAYARQRELWLEKRDKAAILDAARKVKAQPPVAAETAPEPVAVDLRLHTLAGVLDHEVLVQIHCYRASEIAEMVAIADEFGFPIRSFHHALEAYKVRDLLVAHGIAINTWADWWGFKLEAFDGIPENAALFTASGGRATIHSDSATGIQRLNQEAAKAMHAGRAAGIDITEEQALRWITANPAWVLGVDQVTGTLEVGKRADLVVWSGSPFSVYSLPTKVIVAGEIAYEKDKGNVPVDFELGNSAQDRGPVSAEGGGGK